MQWFSTGNKYAPLLPWSEFNEYHIIIEGDRSLFRSATAGARRRDTQLVLVGITTLPRFFSFVPVGCGHSLLSVGWRDAWCWRPAVLRRPPNWIPAVRGWLASRGGIWFKNVCSRGLTSSLCRAPLLFVLFLCCGFYSAAALLEVFLVAVVYVFVYCGCILRFEPDVTYPVFTAHFLSF